MALEGSKHERILKRVLLIIISSALTFVSLILLARSGHIHILTQVVHQVHHAYPQTTGANCHCPKPKECIGPKASQELFPKIFDEVPSLRPINSTPEDAMEVDWEAALLTPNGGFLMVEEWDHRVNGYGVSMFHQLHCLTMIRTMLLGGTMSTEHEVDGETWKQNPLHFLHCLDYVAQAIICAADDALEKPMKTTNFKGDEVDGIDGMGHVHQCRNATMLYERVFSSEKQPIPAAMIGRDSVFP